MARIGLGRAVGLGAVAALVSTGLGVAQAAPDVAPASVPRAIPGPTSPDWIPVTQSGVVATDPTNDINNAAHLNLTPAGGPLETATAFLSADLQHAYFRFHLAAEPDGVAPGGYVVQFDTDGNTAGWERALRLDAVAGTITILTADANSGLTAPGTVATTIPATADTATSYPGADGGAFVAFAVRRQALTAAGIVLGSPMVVGATTEGGATLNNGTLLSPARADILGTGKNNGLGAPGWATVDTDPLDIDSDGDGVVDRLDNCPVDVNPGQEDDDKAVDNSLPTGTEGVPDGTEGQGNACDHTPRGYDLDGDDVGSMDDACPERPGLLANGCFAQSTTTATLTYKVRKKTFSGVVRADYDECVPRRSVTVFRLVKGPDKRIGTTKRTNWKGGYFVKLKKRPVKGTYYAQVDTRLLFDVGARCFAKKSPRIKLR